LTQVYSDQYPELAGILGFKMINDLMNNLQINLFEGPDSVINFALPKKFNEHLSLPRSGRRIRKKLLKDHNNRTLFFECK
jgi:hypothetical protein